MLELLSRTYGTAYAGCLVKITDTVVGVPLRLYNSALGGLLSDSGQVRLNSVGRFSVYVNSASGVYITLYDRQGTPVTTDRTEAASTELENTTDGVAGSATSAQQDALTAGGGGGVVVVDSSGIMYGPDGNVVAAGGGGSTPLVGNLTSTSTTSALRADQGPAITTLINGKYTKPPTGIPATDLSAAVQTAVTAAGTAVQPSNLKTVNGNSLVGVGNVTITSPTLVGANGTVAGTAGLVPAPAATDNTKYLRGDGTWQTVVSGGGAAATNLTATASPTGVTVESDTGTDAALPLSNGTNAGLMAPAQHTKLAGIATGATANSTDAQLRDRTTHTGTQLASTISDFNATAAAAAPVQSVAGKTGVVTLAAADIGDSSLAGRTLLTAADVPAQLSTLGLTNALKTSDIGVTVAGLVGGKINASALPDIAVTDYLGTAADQAAMLAFTAQKGDWCTRTDTGTNWILTGNSAAVLGDWTQLSYPGAPVTSVAGKTGAVTLAKADVGLANVDNTADANKPVSTAQATAIGAKYTKPGTGIPATDLTAAAQTSLGKADTALQPGTNLTQTAVTNTTAAGTALLTATDAAAQRTAMGAQQTLTSGVNIKTVNGLSVLGSGNIQTNQVSYGSVGDTAVVVSLSDLNLVGVPHDLTVVPDTGCAIQIEYSSDGTNYTVFGTAAAKATYEYVRGPGEAAITQVRLTRTSGTSTQSTYAVNGQIQSSVSGGAPSLAALPRGFVAWHNGGGQRVFPGNTISGFEATALAASKSALIVADADLRVTSDNVVCAFHDDTLDAKTTLTGAFSAADFATIRSGSVDASAWLAAGYQNEFIPSFSDYVSACRGKVLMIPEIKSGAARVVAAAKSMGLTADEIMFCSFIQADLVAHVISGGYQACLIVDVLSSPPNWSAVSAAGIKWVQYKYTSSAVDAPQIAAANAAGIRCIAYTIDRRWQYADVVASGAYGIYSDDPVYAASTGQLSVVDTWRSQRWMPGMIQADTAYRGSFPAPGVWEHDTRAASPAGYRGVLLGWAECGPRLEITFEAQFLAVTSDSRWFSFFINGADDRVYWDTADVTSGYHILCRRTGELAIYRKNSGSGTSQIASSAGTTIAFSVWKKFRITRNATDITVANETDGVTATVALGASPPSGRSIHIGSAGAQVQVRNLACQPLP